MTNSKKKPAKKRAYVKKSNKWIDGRPIDMEIPGDVLEPTPFRAKATSKDTEIESLVTICSILDNWSPEQKKRNLQYIVGRYFDFI